MDTAVGNAVVHTVTGPDGDPVVDEVIATVTDAPAAGDAAAGDGDPDEPDAVAEAAVERVPAAADGPVDQVPEHDLSGAIEAVLLVADTPIPEAQIAAAVGHTPGHVRALLAELADNYTAANSGIELREFGGGWRFYTRDRFAPVVERFVLDGAQSRLSKAALETLAVVAYRQPVTRARIAAVRGVNVDGVIRTLMSRGLIQDCGIDADTGGTQYRTTDLFLERMGLDDLSELPSLGPLLPDIGDLDDV
jgi:segregation and condensation protein B